MPNMDTSQERFINDQQLASQLGLQPATLRKWRITGFGPKFRRFGRAVRYSENDINLWLATTPSGGEVEERQ